VVGVKQQASIATRQLIIKLEIQFPSHELMDALGVVSLVKINQIVTTFLANYMQLVVICNYLWEYLQLWD